MKHVTLTMAAVLGLSFTSYAQLGGLMNKASNMANKATNTINSVVPPTTPASSGTSTTTTKTTTTTRSSTPAAAYDPAAPATATRPDRPLTNVVSPAHTRHMGKIVFALHEEDLVTGQEKEAAFVTSHTYDHFLITAAPLYARAYMPISIENGIRHMGPDALFGNARLKVYVDGTLAFATDFDRMRESEKEASTFDFTMKSDRGGGLPLDAAVDQVKEKLTVGQHQVRVEVMPTSGGQDGEVLASGDLTLTVKPKPARELSPTCLPAAGMKDPALEAKIMAAFNAKGWDEKFKSARISGTEWFYTRNQLTGIIIKRSLNTVVAATLNGECRYQSLTFSQNAADKGYQSTMYIDGIGDVTYVKCDCLK